MAGIDSYVSVMHERLLYDRHSMNIFPELSGSIIKELINSLHIHMHICMYMYHAKGLMRMYVLSKP